MLNLSLFYYPEDGGGGGAYLERDLGLSMVQKRQYSKYKQNDHKLSHIFIGSL